MRKLIASLLFIALFAFSMSRVHLEAPFNLDSVAPVIAGNACLLDRETADAMTQDEIKEHIEFCYSLLEE